MMAIYDTMQHLACDVSTTCIGLAASASAVLLAAGEHGKRFALPHSRILIHQPLVTGSIQGQASDIAIHAEEIMKVRATMDEVLAAHTGQTPETDRSRHRPRSMDERRRSQGLRHPRRVATGQIRRAQLRDDSHNGAYGCPQRRTEWPKATTNVSGVVSFPTGQIERAKRANY